MGSPLLHNSSNNLSLSLKGSRLAGRILSLILVAAILASIGSLVYVAAVPRTGEKFSEFYILGMQGKAADYPTSLKAGESGKVILAIINREHETVSYRVDVTVNGETDKQVGPIVLEDKKKWENEISFTLTGRGEKQKVEFLLYRNDENKPYLGPLSLLVNVE